MVDDGVKPSTDGDLASYTFAGRGQRVCCLVEQATRHGHQYADEEAGQRDVGHDRVGVGGSQVGMGDHDREARCGQSQLHSQSSPAVEDAAEPLSRR